MWKLILSSMAWASDFLNGAADGLLDLPDAFGSHGLAPWGMEQAYGLGIDGFPII